MTRQQNPDDNESTAHVAPPPDAVRVVPLPRPFDFAASVRFMGLGPYDPACRQGPGSVWRAARTPRGPVTLHLAPAGEEARARAWGPGADWALERAEAILGLEDEPGAFRPPPGPLATLARRGRGMHLVRAPWVFDALCQVILQQRVSFRDAARGHGRLTRALGETAPGPPGLLLPLSPRDWLSLSSEDFRRAGIDGQRAGHLRAAARKARMVDSTFDREHPEARALVEAIPGCGPWTVGMLAGFALGDPDAVPVGDLHLPSLVAKALVGEPQADDARLLELLEPYRGHRFRLIRLLLAADRIRLGRGGRS